MRLRWMGVLGLAVVSLVSGCASTAQVGDSAATKDPWEKANRVVFKFNDSLDTWVAKPVAKGYRAVAPEPVEQGVSNFFDNIGEVHNVLNGLLQAKWGQAGHDASRFFLNTLAGLGGLVDVAGHVGLEKSQGEDFGQTLQVWGVASGPYLVLPFTGPSTITDAGGSFIDWRTNPPTYMYEKTRNGLTVLDLVHRRAQLLDAEGLVSGDKYIFYREAYLQNRQFLINDGKVEDDFGGDLDDFDDF